MKKGSPKNLRGVMRDTLRDVAGQTAQLASLAHQKLLNNGTPPDLLELQAAFKIVGELSRAGEVIIKEQGGIIFEEGVLSEEKPTQPKTFAELLRTRIEEALPPGKENFRAQEVRDFLGYTGNTKKTGKIMTELGLSRRRILNREDAVRIIEKDLTYPSEAERESYSCSEICSTFNIDLEQLTEWSKLIGHDWNLHPRVDKETALAIQGLADLAEPETKSSVN